MGNFARFTKKDSRIFAVIFLIAMGNEQEGKQSETREVHTLGMFEERDPFVTVARQLSKKVDAEITFFHHLGSPSFVSLAATERGKETVDSARAILTTAPEYRALEITYRQGFDPKPQYVEDLESLAWSLKNSDPIILPEKIKRGIKATFLQNKHKALTRRLNQTIRDGGSQEVTRTIFGLRRMEKTLGSKPLSRRKQTDLVKQIFEQYEVGEIAPLALGAHEFPEVSQDTIGNIHNQIADNHEEFIDEGLKTMKEREKGLCNYLALSATQMSKEEEETMLLGAIVVHQALLREGIRLPQVTVETVNTYFSEVASAIQTLKSLSHTEVWDENTVNEKLKGHELQVVPHPVSRGDENPILMNYIAEKGVVPGPRLLNRFGTGAMVTYELIRRQWSEEQTRKKLQNFGQ